MARIKDIEIIEPVRKFTDKCGEEIGKFEAMNFDIDTFRFFDENNITSPIEQMMYVSLLAVSKLNYYPLQIQPQFVIGEYRVDFLVGCGKKDNFIIVECDSQAFHERSVDERSYEKKRDRFLQKEGYKVFRFTGKEIMKNPLEIAREIVAFVSRTPEDEVSIDSNLE
uniref:DUF559 domain-containing protein n=1 Tax=viral metagenome TaxID=1070528 RepID=A0A6H2A0H4_9ZZZZ